VCFVSFEVEDGQWTWRTKDPFTCPILLGVGEIVSVIQIGTR